jgi:hypothetical protein
MTTTTTARVERTPTHNDLAIADLVHLALAEVQGAGRFGDRKVFIASLWNQMRRIETGTGGTLTADATLEHFKAWLLHSRLLTTDGTDRAAPLVILARADLVSAMDPEQVAASETRADGATVHFVLDPAVAQKEYTPRSPARAAA